MHSRHPFFQFKDLEIEGDDDGFGHHHFIWTDSRQPEKPPSYETDNLVKIMCVAPSMLSNAQRYIDAGDHPRDQDARLEPATRRSTSKPSRTASPSIHVLRQKQPEHVQERPSKLKKTYLPTVYWAEDRNIAPMHPELIAKAPKLMMKMEEKMKNSILMTLMIRIIAYVRPPPTT